MFGDEHSNKSCYEFKYLLLFLKTESERDLYIKDKHSYVYCRMIFREYVKLLSRVNIKYYKRTGKISAQEANIRLRRHN